MKYMLDTNICVYLLKNTFEIIGVFERNKHEGIAISAIVLSELEFGVQNSRDVAINRFKLAAFLRLVEVLSFDKDAAAEYGVICTALRRKGTPIGQMDMLIAAHAKSKGLILVTNNTREFARVEGLKLENWAA